MNARAFFLIGSGSRLAAYANAMICQWSSGLLPGVLEPKDYLKIRDTNLKEYDNDNVLRETVDVKYESRKQLSNL